MPLTCFAFALEFRFFVDSTLYRDEIFHLLYDIARDAFCLRLHFLRGACGAGGVRAARSRRSARALRRLHAFSLPAAYFLSEIITMPITAADAAITLHIIAVITFIIAPEIIIMQAFSRQPRFSFSLLDTFILPPYCLHGYAATFHFIRFEFQYHYLRHIIYYILRQRHAGLAY